MGELVSQKARAYRALSQVSTPEQLLDTYFLSATWGKSEAENVINKLQYTDAFVRPCPEVPNHGGLVGGYESHRVQGYYKDIQQRVREVYTALHEKGVRADLMVQPYIDATLSGVYAPGQYIAIGPGHAGITAGANWQVVLPLRPGYPPGWIKNAGEDPAQAEIEVLATVKQTDGTPSVHVWLAQLRRAPMHTHVAPPPLHALPGFLPQGSTFKVEHLLVIESLDDLGQLEALKEAPPNGTLVIQPGGSLLSHAAAHCRGAALPFAVCSATHFPVGTVLHEAAPGWLRRGEPTGVTTSYSPFQYAGEFLAGLEDGRRCWKPQWGHLGTYFHQWATNPLMAPAQTARYAGGYVSWLVYSGLMACLGEARHIAGRELHDSRVGPCTAGLIATFTELKTMTSDRAMVYTKVSKSSYPWEDARRAARFMGAHTFNKAKVGWVGAVGGTKWADAARLVERLAEACQQVAQDATKLPALIQIANQLENSAHNCGWLFNKFLQPDVMTAATQGFQESNLYLAFLAAYYASGYGTDPRPERNLSAQLDQLDQWKLTAPFNTTTSSGGSGHPIPGAIALYEVTLQGAWA